MLNLAVLYSLRCNIRCAHCSVSAGPTVGRRMTLAFARDILRQSASIDLIDRITFTGGEVLLLQRDILDLVAYATALGKKTRIVSNGFWARRKESGRALLAQLRAAGLTELHLSADEYHYDELPPGVTKNAAELLHEFDYAVVINRIERRGGDTLGAFADRCGLDRERLVLYQPRFSLADVESIGRQQIVVRHIGLSIEGRAASLGGDTTLRPLGEFDGPCLQPVRAPSISPEGLLFPCCAPGSNYETFQIGNVHDTPLDELIQKLLDDPLSNFISTYGPAALMRVLARTDPAFDRKYSDICNMCCTALRRYSGDELRAIVRKVMVDRTLTLLGLTPAPATLGQ